MNMIKNLFLPVILVVLGILASAAALAAPVPVSIDAVEVDGFALNSADVNIRDLERGETFDLKIKLTATGNVSNVEIRAFVSGYEFSKKEDISDSTSPFSVESGTSYVKKLTLSLPERADEDRYRITVVISGRDTDIVSEDYRIKVTPTDNEVVIKDFSIDPVVVQAGRAAVATVRIKNIGDREEEDVRIKVSIPELGVSPNPDNIDSLESEESATSEDFLLRISPCAKPGTYDVKAEVTFEEGDDMVTETSQITVTEGPCDKLPGTVPAAAGGVKIYEPQVQNVQAGASASFPIVIENSGSSTRIFSLTADGSDWATVTFSPGQMVTVRPGDSQIVNVMVAVNGKAVGTRTLVVKVRDQALGSVKDVSIVANVAAGTIPSVGNVEDLVQILQMGLIALIAVLVVVGLVVAFRRMKGPKEGEEGTQTYY